MYDSLYPIYDPELELHQPTDRPLEFKPSEWPSGTEDQNAWYEGVGAREWSHYPDSVKGPVAHRRADIVRAPRLGVAP